MEDEKIIELYFQRSEDAIPETELKYGSRCRAVAYNILESRDWTPHLEQYERVKATCPKGLELCLGVELGSAQFMPELGRKLMQGIQPDMVVGSAHNLSFEHGGLDFIELHYDNQAACWEALDDYFHSLTLMSVMEEFDVLAHIPYTLRYMSDRDGNRITLERYRSQLEIIFFNLIHRGAGIEFNTNRGKSLERYRPLLEQYRQLGGEIVTLGSDAHRPEDIGKGIPEAAELLREMGFRYYTVFRRRKPEFIPL